MAKIYSNGSWVDITDLRVYSGGNWINPSRVSVYSGGWKKIYPPGYDMSNYLTQERTGFLNGGINAHFEPTGWSNDYSYSTRATQLFGLGLGTVKVFVQYGATTSYWGPIINGIISNGRVPIVSLLGYWESGSAVPVNTEARIIVWTTWVIP